MNTTALVGKQYIVAASLLEERVTKQQEEGITEESGLRKAVVLFGNRSFGGMQL
jgi:hypothetical protein